MQVLVNVTVELFPLGLMLLMILTSHVTLSGAPPGPAFRLLHWLNETVAAAAGSGFEASSIKASTPNARSSAMPGASLVARRPVRLSLVSLEIIQASLSYAEASRGLIHE